MIYEIINPSGPYTIEGDFKTCCVATCILGEGKYGVQGGDQVMPPFLFSDPDEWFVGRFGMPFGDTLRSLDHATLADCLDSVLCCGAKERAVYDTALASFEDEEGRLVQRLIWHDARRSSLNDIGRRAWALAKRVRG